MNAKSKIVISLLHRVSHPQEAFRAQPLQALKPLIAGM
jgi:hypothetical protein